MTTAVTRELTESDLEDFPSENEQAPRATELSKLLADVGRQFERLSELELADERLPRRFLAAYYGGLDLRRGDIFGYFACGSSCWVLSNEPRGVGAEEDPAPLWAVPYAGTRYAYRFQSYNRDECDFGRTSFARLLLEKDVPRPGDTVSHRRSHDGGCCITIIQTDEPLPGWDNETDMLDELENDDLGGELDLIDTAEPADESDAPWDRWQKTVDRIEQVRADELDRDFGGLDMFRE
jgi:hypothetical protein